MHLDAMYVFIIIDVQHVESFFQFELVYHFNVDLQWAEGSVVLVQVGESASWKILMVGWSEDEDSFDVIGSSDIWCNATLPIHQNSYRAKERLRLVGNRHRGLVKKGDKK